MIPKLQASETEGPVERSQEWLWPEDDRLASG